MDLSIVLTTPPYGRIEAAEAIRHALGAVAEEFETAVILFDGGVLLAKKGQDEGDSGFTALGSSLSDIAEMGGRVLADKSSLNSFEISRDDLVEGVEVKSGYELSEIIKSSVKTMVF